MMEWPEEKEHADVTALEEAKMVLEVIKGVDPGVYDEMIDEALRLINTALSLQNPEPEPA
jgi:hypothetical protein